jgi:flagellar motor switch/type III secretory pathway protein FliN
MKITQELTQLLVSFIQKVLQEQNAAISPLLEVTLQDGDETKVFRTQDSIVSIGRSVTNEIELPDRFISREHAKIIKKHHRYLLLDLGSTNGTYLNRQVLEQNREYPLKTGDVVQMERFRLHVNIETAEEIAGKQIQITTQSVTDEPFKEFLKGVQPADALAIYEVPPDCHQIYLQLEAPVLLKLLGQKVFSTKPEHSKIWLKFENSLVEFEHLINKNFQRKLGYRVNFLKLENPQDLHSVTEVKLSVLKLKIRIGEQSGYLRVGIPRILFKSLIENINAQATPSDAAAPKIPPSSGGSSDSGQEGNLLEPASAAKSARLSRLEKINTTLHLELGTFTISSLEWLKLGLDQIILLKGINCLDEAGNFSGEIRLRLPSDDGRYWIGDLKTAGDSYTIKIIKTIKMAAREIDVSGRMLFLTEDNATIESDEFESDSGNRAAEEMVEEKLSAEDKVRILKEINLLLTIELNRLKLKVADIINLKPGKIIQIKYPLSKKVTITMKAQSLARATLFTHARGLAVRILEILAN